MSKPDTPTGQLVPLGLARSPRRWAGIDIQRLASADHDQVIAALTDAQHDIAILVLALVGKEIRLTFLCDDEAAAKALHAGLVEEARDGDVHLRLLVADVTAEH